MIRFVAVFRRLKRFLRCPVRSLKVTYDFHHESSRKVLVPSKVVWMGLGSTCHLARMGYVRGVWTTSGRCKHILSPGKFTLGLFRMRLGPERSPVGNLLCKRRAPEWALRCKVVGSTANPVQPGRMRPVLLDQDLRSSGRTGFVCPACGLTEISLFRSLASMQDFLFSRSTFFKLRAKECWL
jgi:hypothetical protein